jgi:chorismate-pyruvate lyase
MAGFSLAALLLTASAPQATLEEFEAALDATPSATQALETWCHARFDQAASVHAMVISTSSDTPTDRIRDALQIHRDEQLGYRRVRLSCAGREMSLAYNWYVPARLSPEMSRQLTATDTPFGRVAAPLRFTREPIAKPWSGPELCPDGTILAHRALLRLPDRKPLAMVVECYTRANIAAVP